MNEKVFYMISEDCFERKEFLGSIVDEELRYLAAAFSMNPDFSLAKLKENLLENLQLGEEYLKGVVEDNFLIQKYRDLISYTEGAEIFMLASVLEREKQNIADHSILEEDKNYQKLEEKYYELLLQSEEKYRRFQSSQVVR